VTNKNHEQRNATPVSRLRLPRIGSPALDTLDYLRTPSRPKTWSGGGGSSSSNSSNSSRSNIAVATVMATAATATLPQSPDRKTRPRRLGTHNIRPSSSIYYIALTIGCIKYIIGTCCVKHYIGIFAGDIAVSLWETQRDCSDIA